MTALDFRPLGQHDEADDSSPRQFPASMAKHLIRSLMTRHDHITIIAVASDKVRASMEDQLWSMNSLACDARPDMFVAKSQGKPFARVAVLLDCQDHASIQSACVRSPVTGSFVVVTEDPITRGSPLDALLAKRQGDHIQLVTTL